MFHNDSKRVIIRTLAQYLLKESNFEYPFEKTQYPFEQPLIL